MTSASSICKAQGPAIENLQERFDELTAPGLPSEGTTMSKILDFLKTTAAGGFFVIFPLILFYLLMAEILDLIVGMATPIADVVFPKGTFDAVTEPVLVAILILLGASFVVGIAARSNTGKRVGNWIEQHTIGSLPLYKAVKELAKGFAGSEAFRPALLRNSESEQEIVYVIEDHDDGRHTVLVPWAPASFAGTVKIVSGDRIELLDTGLADVSRILSQWGVGTRELLKQNDKSHEGSSGGSI
jgi:uncharacterized membrane protein